MNKAIGSFHGQLLNIRMRGGVSIRPAKSTSIPVPLGDAASGLDFEPESLPFRGGLQRIEPPLVKCRLERIELINSTRHPLAKQSASGSVLCVIGWYEHGHRVVKVIDDNAPTDIDLGIPVELMKRMNDAPLPRSAGAWDDITIREVV